MHQSGPKYYLRKVVSQNHQNSHYSSPAIDSTLIGNESSTRFKAEIATDTRQRQRRIRHYWLLLVQISTSATKLFSPNTSSTLKIHYNHLSHAFLGILVHISLSVFNLGLLPIFTVFERNQFGLQTFCLTFQWFLHEKIGWLKLLYLYRIAFRALHTHSTASTTDCCM